MDRREFLKTSGALVISFAAPSFEAIAQSAGKPALVPGEPLGRRSNQAVVLRARIFHAGYPPVGRSDTLNLKQA